VQIHTEGQQKSKPEILGKEHQGDKGVEQNSPLKLLGGVQEKISIDLSCCERSC
jgi:hypothetical protein